MRVPREVALDIHTEAVAVGSCSRTSIGHCFALAGRLSVEEGVEEGVEGGPIHHCIEEAVAVAADSPTFCFKLKWCSLCRFSFADLRGKSQRLLKC